MEWGARTGREGAGQEGWQGEERKWGAGMQTGRRGEQAFPESQNKTIQKTGEEKQNGQNRKRIGNLLIKANQTCDSILVRIYITPHTDPGTPVATSGPADTVRNSFTPPLVALP